MSTTDFSTYNTVLTPPVSPSVSCTGVVEDGVVEDGVHTACGAAPPQKCMACGTTDGSPAMVPCKYSTGTNHHYRCVDCVLAKSKCMVCDPWEDYIWQCGGYIDGNPTGCTRLEAFLETCPLCTVVHCNACWHRDTLGCTYPKCVAQKLVLHALPRSSSIV